MTSDAVTLFVDRPAPCGSTSGCTEPQTAAAVTEICETLDGLPLGIELAAARMAAMSAVEVQDRLADRFRLLRGSTPRPERQLTLRHAVEWSYDLLDRRRAGAAAHRVGLRRRLRPGEHLRPSVDGADDVDVLRHLDSLVRKSLVVADHTATADALPAVRDDPAVRRGPVGRSRRARANARPARRVLRGARPSARWEHWNGPGWRDAVDWVEAELGNLRAGFRWSAARGDLEVATDIAAHAALMGFSVQLFETLAWAEELLEPRRGRGRPRGSPASTPRPATRASRAGPRRHARTRTGPTELEVDPRYDACEPGYAIVRRGAGRGLLRRPRPLRRAHRRRWRERYGSDRGLRPRLVRRRSPVVRPHRGGARAHRGVGRRGAVARQPVLDRLRALDRGAWRSPRPIVRRAFAAWDEGVAFVREHRVQFFEGFLARDAARLHTSDGEPEAALVLFADAIAAFHRAGNVPQLIITLASVPALFERLDRLAAGGDAARRAVARAVELPPRSRARRARRPARPRQLGSDARRGAASARAPRSTSAMPPSYARRADRRRPPRPDAARARRRGPAA